MPNSMNITPPTPGVTPGPEWAGNGTNSINDILTSIVAEHNHQAPNGGVPLTQDALAIDGDLSLNGNALTAAEKVVLAVQGSAPSTTASVYNLGGNLYYKNGSGLAIQITDATGLAANSVDGISGLAGSDGGASYSAGQFTWTTNNGLQYALMNLGAINVYNYTVANPIFRTSIVQPNTLTANKTFQLGTTNIYFPNTLPATIPETMQLTSTGIIQTYTPASSSVSVASVSVGSSDTLCATLSLTGTGRPIEISLQPRQGNVGGMNLFCANATSTLGTNAPCNVEVWAIVNGTAANRAKLKFRLYDPIAFGGVGGGALVNPSFTFNYTPASGESEAGMTIELYAVSSDATNFTTSLNQFTFTAREI